MLLINQPHLWLVRPELPFNIRCRLSWGLGWHVSWNRAHFRFWNFTHILNFTHVSKLSSYTYKLSNELLNYFTWISFKEVPDFFFCASLEVFIDNFIRLVQNLANSCLFARMDTCHVQVQHGLGLRSRATQVKSFKFKNRPPIDLCWIHPNLISLY